MANKQHYSFGGNTRDPSIQNSEPRQSTNLDPDAKTVINCQQETVKSIHDNDLGIGARYRSNSTTNRESYSVQTNQNRGDPGSENLAEKFGFGF